MPNIIVGQINRDKLLEARKLIQEVRKTLNLRGTECSCCGRTKYEDWSAMQLDKELGAIATKLDRFGHSNT